MFWVMPRAHAERALAASLDTLVECTRGQPCCNSTHITGKSMWMIEYWGHHVGFRVEYNALLGSAVLSANANKTDRDCTLRLGCWRMGDHSEEVVRG